MVTWTIAQITTYIKDLQSSRTKDESRLTNIESAAKLLTARVSALEPPVVVPPVPNVVTTVSYGIIEYLNPSTGGVMPTQACLDWFKTSKMDWVMVPYWTRGGTTDFASQLLAAGKKVILQTSYHGGTVVKQTWTDFYNSMMGDKVLYNAAVANMKNAINEVGDTNLYGMTIEEEQPDCGYNGVLANINMDYFLAVHNQMYKDMKAAFPTLRIFPCAHIARFTDAQLNALLKDGIVDDVYTDNQATLTAWFTRMISFAGANAFCAVHGAYADPYYDAITPTVVTQTAALAKSLNVPHLGWWAFDCSVYPNLSIIFNTWAATSPQQAFKDAILNTVG